MTIKINDQFIINLQGKSFVTYEGLLDYAHQNGLISIEVEVLQIPDNSNNMTAICMATAKTENATFTDVGDASPRSVTNTLVPHIIRMASTRAKARALRDLTNIGMTAYEELTVEDNNSINPMTLEKPTKRQLDKLKELSHNLNYEVDYNALNKKTAASLISELINKSNSIIK